jgi:metal-sulfur cluster biosynthetic enzyme
MILAALQERLLAALEMVRDPELDEPITSLGFVASCTVSADKKENKKKKKLNKTKKTQKKKIDSKVLTKKRE